MCAIYTLYCFLAILLFITVLPLLSWVMQQCELNYECNCRGNCPGCNRHKMTITRICVCCIYMYVCIQQQKNIYFIKCTYIIHHKHVGKQKT